MKMIELQDVSKRYDQTLAVQNMTLHVDKGEILGLLGPSGAGKTTTIQMLTAQMRPSNGTCWVLGQDTTQANPAFFHQMGVLSDNSGQYERLTIWQNLALFADLYEIDRKRVMEILQKVGLAQDKDKPGKSLSKGMKQRLNLARTLLHHPQVLFLDEPTSSLDPSVSNDIHQLLLDLKRDDVTIFLTTHDMEEADKLCDRVAFINEGKVIDVDTPRNLKSRYGKGSIRVALKDHMHPVNVPMNIEGMNRIIDWLAQNQVVSLHSDEPNLEDIFINLTGRGL